jgi:hypothetical protein
MKSGKIILRVIDEESGGFTDYDVGQGIMN